MNENKQAIETVLKQEIVGTTLPTAFEVYTKKLFGEERYNVFCKGLQQPSPVSIRLNPFKTSETLLIASRPLPWLGAKKVSI